MWVFLDYLLLYRTLMIVTIIVVILCVWSTMGLMRGGKNAYRNSVILLLVGSIVAFIQFYASLQIRGKAIPANFKFYTNAITLLIFLLLRLPGIRDRVDFSEPGKGPDKATTGGLTALVTGMVVLTTAIWVGSSHIYIGNNWVDVLQLPLNVSGAILMFGGLARLLWAALGGLTQRRRERDPPE